MGSSQTKSLGCVASALAIDILCLCPPENSCGYRFADFWVNFDNYISENRFMVTNSLIWTVES